MPIYDYKCECGKTKQNVLAKFSDTIKCECGKEMERCISAPNIGGMDNLGRSKKAND